MAPAFHSTTLLARLGYKMKNLVPLLTLCASLVASAPALAASSTDVSVTGMITPAACTPSLSGAGSFDFGKISAQDLNQDRNTSFESPMQRLTVACSSPTRFAVDAIDNRAGTAHSVSASMFGLGLNGTEKIGGYWMGVQGDGINADGNTNVTRLSSSNGGAWAPVAGAISYLTHRNAAASLLGFATQGDSEPSAISTLSADLQVFMEITKARDLTLTNDIAIDGSSSIEVTYL
ncbi:DUF1120 domain-containing protein [Pseudomonas sp. zfem004]|uniref:DUF1120 domain-containing protein n=1 Tax=Pseudomonas sp. zfem004 TaxID=3078199 RepID=UPI00292941A8|nr:DUF1120 domain-containing protein [Pseudomonas sp. zfem004]MDU9402460.1 DUF1120 domain-containing protein [Pseudomonas sp. zfem004]